MEIIILKQENRLLRPVLKYLVDNQKDVSIN